MALGNTSRARLLTVIAATTISLACGTNYVYSAWGPQFAQQLKLSATESNLIGASGNLGMYTTGIPLGIMVDRFGPRFGVALGILLFIFGYYPLARAFDAGAGAYSVAVLCIFSFFTGAGSNSGFLGAVKIAALNYPESRGTATSFPLAAFGLSAFAFATVALALPHDTAHFLLLLAVGTVVLPIISLPFMNVYPSAKPSYRPVSQHDVQPLHQSKVTATRKQINQPDTGALADTPQNTPKSLPSATSSQTRLDEESSDESSSLLSNTSSTDMADLETCKSIDSDSKSDGAHLDIRGFALIYHAEFWQQFCMLGLLTGIGLMTINNIGNDATALWRHYDPSTTSAFISKRQVMHVSILSVCSFSGRLLSGIGSDVLVSRYDRSRFWCLFASAAGFCCAQLLAIFIQQPTLLVLVSGMTGLSYGMLFGVYPSLVAHTFGVHGLSQNWGTMCLAPVISGNIFNILYGRIYDAHSIVEDDGTRECIEGKSCYRSAYMVTFVSSLVGILICLWSIRHESMVHSSGLNSRRKEEHERIA